DGSLWVGTDRGLCQLKDKKVSELFTSRTGLPSDEVQMLFVDADDTLWIGTSDGLVTWRDGKLSKVQKPGGISGHESIVGIVEGDEHSILVATNDGRLFEYINGEWSQFETHQSIPSSISSLHHQDGILYILTAGDGLYVCENGRTIHLSVREGLYDDEL